MKHIVIAGFDKELVASALTLGYECLGILDQQPVQTFRNVRWLGPDPVWLDYKLEFPEAKVIIGVDDAVLRRKLFNFFGEAAISGLHACDEFATSVHIPSSTVIQSRVYIGDDATFGTGCKINIAAAIHHDCQIGAFCTIAPGARLLGSVQVGQCAFIGACATILPKVRIGDGAIVGAGAVVTKDVAPGSVVVGNPARHIRNNAKWTC